MWCNIQVEIKHGTQMTLKLWIMTLLASKDNLEDWLNKAVSVGVRGRWDITQGIKFVTRGMLGDRERVQDSGHKHWDRMDFAKLVGWMMAGEELLEADGQLVSWRERDPAFDEIVVGIKRATRGLPVKMISDDVDSIEQWHWAGGMAMRHPQAHGRRFDGNKESLEMRI